jgi:hypothetical protein
MNVNTGGRRSHGATDAGRLESMALLGFQLCLGLFTALGALLTVFLPYHVWDALAYGEWSRLIALTGGFHFPTVTPQTYHRPLFYVTQGWLWRLLGFNEAYGRGLGLMFWGLLVWSVWRLCRYVCADASPLAPWLGVALLLAIGGVAAGVCNGMTDVPVAALVGAAGAVLWTVAGPRRQVAVGTLSCAAVLVKPSSLTALAGLGLADLLDDSTDGRLRRLVRGGLPMTTGVVVALLYDSLEAHRLHMTVVGFITAGTTGFHEQERSVALLGALSDWSWLGAGLRFPLLFGVGYALCRVANVKHRTALVSSAIVGLVLTWMVPWISAGQGWTGAGIVVPGKTAINAAYLLSAVALATASGLSVGERAVTPRVNIARLLVWLAPGVFSWLWYAAYDSRLLSAIWAPAAVLLGCVMTPLVSDALSQNRWLGGSSVLVILFLATSNVARFDGLGFGWLALGRSIAAGQIGRDHLRHVLMPELMDLVAVLNDDVRAGETIISPEGRLRFFFPGQVQQTFPSRCQDLAGYDLFVLAKGARMEQLFETDVGVPGTETYWSGCQLPSITLVQHGEAYAVFRIDR